MRRAGTNAPVGANYNKAFGLWLDEHQWVRELDKATRNMRFGPPKIVAKSSAGAERPRPNEPPDHSETSLRRHAQDGGSASRQGETRVEKLEHEIERLTFEVEAWRKKAEADGSLFDLKKDSVKVIATTIAGNVSLHRLTALQKALWRRDQGKSRLRKKQAG